MLQKEKLNFFDTKPSNSSENYYLEPGLYHSITDFVEAMNTLLQETHNHTETSLAVRGSPRKRKVEIHLANGESHLAFLTTDLGHLFGIDVGNDFGVLLRGKRRHKPMFADGFDRAHSLMIYTDLIEYNLVGDTKVRLLLCFAFISQLKSEENITTGQYMNYRTFSNLQFFAAQNIVSKY